MDMFREFETVSTPEATAYRKPGAEPGRRAPQTNWQPFVWEGQSGEGVPGKLAAPVLEPTAAPEAPIGKPAGPVATVEDVRTLADSGHWDAATALRDKLLKAEPLNPATHFV